MLQFDLSIGVTWDNYIIGPMPCSAAGIPYYERGPAAGFWRARFIISIDRCCAYPMDVIH